MAKYLLFFAQKDEEDAAVELDSFDDVMGRIRSECELALLGKDPESMPIITFSIGDISAVSRD